MSLPIRLSTHKKRDTIRVNPAQKKPYETKAVLSRPPRCNCKAPTRLLQLHIRSHDSLLRDESNEEMANKVKILTTITHSRRRHLNAEDLRESIGEFHMAALLHQLSEVLFDRGLVTCEPLRVVSFGWLDKNEPDTLGQTGDTPYRCKIELNPVLTSPLASLAYPHAFDGRRQCRLSTLIHELCHAFFSVNLCFTCNSRVHHGAAWQMLAQYMETVSSNLLGMRIDLDRCFSLFMDEAHCLRRSRGGLDWGEFNLADTVYARIALEKPELLGHDMVEKCRAIELDFVQSPGRSARHFTSDRRRVVITGPPSATSLSDMNRETITATTAKTIEGSSKQKDEAEETGYNLGETPFALHR